MWNGGYPAGSTSLSPAISKAAPSGNSQDNGIAFLVKQTQERLSGKVIRFSTRSKNMNSATPINSTYNGKVSGTETDTGSIDPDTGKGTLTVTYVNFNDGDGRTYDGTFTLKIDAYNMAYDMMTDWTMSCTLWTVKSADSNVSLSGSVREQKNLQSNSDTTTINVDVRDNIGNETFRFENYIVTSVSDNLLNPTAGSESYTGRMYVEKYGYVDISTVSPCIYSGPQGDPDSGGPIVLAGAGHTRAKITPVSSSYVKIEVDHDGDGAYDDKNAYAWNNLGTPITSACFANAGLDQTTAAGSLVTLDGGGSTDLNGGPLTYSWTMTEKPAGSGAVMSSPSQATTSFVADVAGSYTMSLVVSNGMTTSDPDTVVVTANGPTTGSVPTLSSIVVTPANPSIANGTTQQFTAKGSYSNLSVQNITMSVTWNSSNTSVATIDNAGLATVLSAGTTTITAMYGNITGSTLLTSIGAANGVQIVSLATNDIIYDPLRGRIYASVPGRAGSLGNTITVIDPATGATGTSVFAGSEPGKMALSDDGQFLYVSLDGAAAVRRLTLATMTPEIQFSLGSDSASARYVDDMEVLPGQPHSVAISRKILNLSPRFAGVAIYDDGIQRPATASPFSGSINAITFSENASTLYGYNNETTEFGFYRMNIDASGVSITDVSSNTIYGFAVDIVFDGGLVYATSGQVVNPGNLTPVLAGSFPGIFYSNAVCPDSALGRTFFVDSKGTSYTYTVSAFDQTTLSLLGKIMIQGNAGVAGRLIRWGANGLAFRTSGDQIFLLKNPVFQ